MDNKLGSVLASSTIISTNCKLLRQIQWLRKYIKGRRYDVLPTVHCFQWDILYRLSPNRCWVIVINDNDETCLKCKIGMSYVTIKVCFITIAPLDLLYNYWKQCIVGSISYLYIIIFSYTDGISVDMK